MLRHYLTVAFRNLWKYKNQTLISVTGLAVGFTCFAMAMLWIRYEMTYDSFHKNADRIYCVSQPDKHSTYGVSRKVSYHLAAYLKETFPEISHATPILSYSSGRKYYPNEIMIIDGVEYPVEILRIDSTFFNLFDVKIIEGNKDFVIAGSQKAAITQEKARLLFGNDDPVGKNIHYRSTDYIICAVVAELPRHSNYVFEVLVPEYSKQNKWLFASGPNHTLIELASEVDVEVFRKKLYEHIIGRDRIEFGKMEKMTITPLTSIHYEAPEVELEVKFEHIKLFALSGALVILCTLFNYLTLFVSRFRMRQKELALRRVCGASGRSLFALLSVEFILTLLTALLSGLIFIQLVHHPFQRLSEIQMELSDIYGETILYIGAVIMFLLLSFRTVLAIFRRSTLNSFIRKSNKNVFRKISVVVQLIISIGFAFCSIIIVKQIYFLHNTADLGFDFKNSGHVVVFFEGFDVNVLENQIKQIPEITETIGGGLRPLIPLHQSIKYINRWDGKQDDAEMIEMNYLPISEQYAKYYGLRLLEGELINDTDAKNMVLINESAAKTFGWNKPLGKSLGNYTVKGVLKDIYNMPTVPAKPLLYLREDYEKPYADIVLFKYSEGTWKACREKIEKLMEAEYPNVSYYFENAEEEYDYYLKSENALLKLLSFVSLICIIICIFGFVSLVSLTCEERRKEIAIRKINGATAMDILSIFFNEYFLLLLIGAAIAFPVGNYIMRMWLEQYMRQTSIPAWIYLSILSALVFVIVLCVGWRVYKASVENPADVIK